MSMWTELYLLRNGFSGELFVTQDRRLFHGMEVKVTTYFTTSTLKSGGSASHVGPIYSPWKIHQYWWDRTLGESHILYGPGNEDIFTTFKPGIETQPSLPIAW